MAEYYLPRDYIVLGVNLREWWKHDDMKDPETGLSDYNRDSPYHDEYQAIDPKDQMDWQRNHPRRGVFQGFTYSQVGKVQSHLIRIADWWKLEAAIHYIKTGEIVNGLAFQQGKGDGYGEVILWEPQRNYVCRNNVMWDNYGVDEITIRGLRPSDFVDASGLTSYREWYLKGCPENDGPKYGRLWYPDGGFVDSIDGFAEEGTPEWDALQACIAILPPRMPKERVTKPDKDWLRQILLDEM